MSKILSCGILRLFRGNTRLSNKFLKQHKIWNPKFEKQYQTQIIANSKFKFDLENHNIRSEIRDKEYKPSNDPDTFGGSYCLSDESDDADDLKEEEYIKELPSRDKETIKYARCIKRHLDKRQVKEALDVLEVEMKRDRIHPDRYIFNLLISGCAKVGYTRKAFKLFFKMKQYGLKPSGGTLTSLFNACANAPTISDGLAKANRLREIMIESDLQPNEKNYNAMIKAYGRCKDLSAAFQIADEMREKCFLIQTETFNFLLQACASDMEFGFRHALLIWHKMKRNDVRPDIYSFNTILRCVKNCSIGDLESMYDVINDIINKSKNFLKEGEGELKVIASNENGGSCVQTSESNTNISSATQTDLVLPKEVFYANDVPNLLCSNPHLGNLIKINEIRKPEDRLLLIGGFSGFLREMKFNKVTPNIETFTMLLEVIPSTNSAEKTLISTIKKDGLKADIDFFNTLIKKRCLRFDYDGAKEVLNMIKSVKLKPDIFTYGILSLSCKTKEEARELLKNMKQRDMSMNTQILGAMLNQGCRNQDFDYITEIMQIALDEKIRPNEAFLCHLSKFNQQCAKLVNVRHKISKSLEFQRNYKKFREHLHMWYEENGISGLTLEEQIEKVKRNPYKKFKEKTKADENDTVKKKKIRKHIKNVKLHDLSINENKEKAEGS
ncbi:pentatricopeptide repeat-containing protein 1, mitochondrial [Condylostylus longicornis]|uniref:pentatricopeptide repeat-containing protein 1, mitochondrial n=1 Tax=Condylostylus longicornis TaxID=2530218 RepID=UPI00244E31B9|nr:pentatricopeptide repeat-containing protein 1, mitochondrial [Condylostylus longicornis]